jgi:hypothetical protein
MSVTAAAVLMAFTVQAQQLPEPGRRMDEPPKTEKRAPHEPTKKPRPRISVKPKGGTGSAIGDDKPGGGPPASESSKGGTPGTPSGSFTGAPPRP